MEFPGVPMYFSGILMDIPSILGDLLIISLDLPWNSSGFPCIPVDHCDIPEDLPGILKIFLEFQLISPKLKWISSALDFHKISVDFPDIRNAFLAVRWIFLVAR